jgi:histidinol dehydrogenase
MKTYRYPAKELWSELAKRPAMTTTSLDKIVGPVFENIIKNGEQSVKDYTLQFDRVLLSDLEVKPEEADVSEELLSPELKLAIQQAKKNIEVFHTSQKEEVHIVETMPGVSCWRKSLPVDTVGLYIPGGTAPLFSTVLMLAVPAQIAGCRQIILCSPPNKEGKIHPAILYAAKLCGVTQIFKVGGIQAIAAMTVGTENIPKVNKIFGPGNQYVTAAKQESLKYGVAIDLPAGPSELLVIADTSTPPDFIAADLLSQAEHGTDSQVILLTHQSKVIEDTILQIETQLGQLPRKEIALKALENSLAIQLDSLDECVEFSNLYAPEHLIIATQNYDILKDNVPQAGSVFLGPYSCESIGDYASGTNHTLPTSGYARNYSGVSLDSFCKKVTFQSISEEGLKNIGPMTEIMAEAEELEGHKKAVSVRLDYLKINM